MNDSHERTTDRLEQSFESTGVAIFKALAEFAQNSGDDELGAILIELAGGSSTIFPNSAAFKHLNDNFAGAAQAVMVRAEEIHDEESRGTEANDHQLDPRKLGKVLLSDTFSFSLAPPSHPLKDSYK